MLEIFALRKYLTIRLTFLIAILLFFTNLSFGGNGDNLNNTSDSVGNFQVAEWKSDRKSAFSFSFDDSFISQFENIRPILNQFGFRGTFYVLPLFLTEELPGIWRYGTWPMFEAMALEGHEIGSHSMTHPHLPELETGDTLTEGTISYELYWSRQLIRQRITTQACITFAYPYAEHNEIVDSIASLYYESARGVTGEPNPPSITGMQWYSLNAIETIFDEPRNTPEDDLDELEFIKNLIDSSIIKGDWSIFLAHESVPYDSLAGLIAAGAWNPLSNQWLQALCEWVYNRTENNEIWVAPVGFVTRYVKERDSYTYNLLMADEDQIKLNVTDNLDDGIFNYPLTSFITVPADWNFVLMLQGDRIDTLTAFNKDSSRVVMAEVIPDGGILSLYKMNITTVENDGNKIPDEFILYQNYPNPFNPSTNIRYAVSSRQFISIRVYDVLGNEVAALVNEEKQPGIYEVEFNTSRNNVISSGVYFYQLRAGNQIITKKMLLVR